MKIAVIGGVGSTKILVEKLRQHDFDQVYVFGYQPPDVSLVSGWVDLRRPAENAGFIFSPFNKISDCQLLLDQIRPDWIFAVGLSQLIPPSMLGLSKNGNIGFHPTALPAGRGRAPIAWLVLEQKDGAASFFLMREGVDDGPLLAQVPFVVSAEDDASTVENKVLTAEALALDGLLPAIRAGMVVPLEQDHSRATFYGRRTPDDGWLDWYATAEELHRLIRASTTPHPGAYTFQGMDKITILRAKVPDHCIEKGVVGRVLQCQPDGRFVVQCGSGHLQVTDWRATGRWQPRVGQKLGYYIESEVYSLHKKLHQFEQRLARLEAGSATISAEGMFATSRLTGTKTQEQQP
jgi:methionyl-tRNA formyltransferase